MRQLDAIKGASTNIVLRELDQSSFDSVNVFGTDLAGELSISLFSKQVNFFPEPALGHTPNKTQYFQASGIPSTWRFTTATHDGLETDLQVNIIAPTQLYPPPTQSSLRPRVLHEVFPHDFVSSGLHETAKFPERNWTSDIMSAVNDPHKYDQQDRYVTSKAVGLIWSRELASRVSNADIIINSTNPGFCKTGAHAKYGRFLEYMVKLMEVMLARSTADGARCQVDAAMVKGAETHGKYLSQMSVKQESAMVGGSEGRELNGKLRSEIATLSKDKAGLKDIMIHGCRIDANVRIWRNGAL